MPCPVGWACGTANVADNSFQWLIRQVEERMRGYSNKKPEYLVYQEEGMDEAFRVVSDVAGER